MKLLEETGGNILSSILLNISLCRICFGIYHINISLFLGSLSCSIEVCVWFVSVPYCFDYHRFVVQFKVKECDTTKFLLPWDCFSNLGSFYFNTIWRNVSDFWGKGSKSKSKQNGQTKRILHSEVSYQQNENTAYRMGEVICKWYIK